MKTTLLNTVLAVTLGVSTAAGADEVHPLGAISEHDGQVALNQTRQAGGRVVAVGTTSVRALETAARQAVQGVGAFEGPTDLFILPGYPFRAVDGLITNFHLPKSTLLMMISAFAGRERVLACYAEARDRGYRFYSFGDAMLIL